MQAFAERARDEARRYGSDPWVFVRELLQNARDAGARRVTFEVTQQGELTRLRCRDDGRGMDLEHARRYLFRLYSSSKDGRAGEAGRFGVGFWSVLLFEPRRLRVRSWPAAGEPWEAAFDGELRGGVAATPAPQPTGTEVVLERPGARDDIAARVAAAARHHARFLTRLGSLDEALDVRVDGRPTAEAFDLPAPRIAFRRRGLRGVAGLGREARVELWAKGLRVRSASTLDELSALAPDTSPVMPATASGGLWPVVLIDSHDVELPLARDDARGGAAVERLVRAARHELERLLREQVECLSPRPVWRRALDALKGRGAGLARSVIVGCAAFAAGAWAAQRLRHAESPPAAVTAPGPVARAMPREIPDDAPGSKPAAPAPHRELGLFYGGPRSDADPSSRPHALHYRPAEAQPLFAALWLTDPHQAPRPPQDVRAYPEPEVLPGAGLQVTLIARSRGGWTRLPVPSGMRIDPRRVSVDGRASGLRAGALGEPLVRLPAGDSVVEYTSVPARAAAWDWSTRPLARPPRELEIQAQALARAPREEIVGRATGWVARRVRYSLSPETQAAHARLASLPLAQRALSVGAGDCDVQNGLLTLLLRAAGTPARLAVGYVGADGGVLPGLHAWVEYLDGQGRWNTADASRVSAGEDDTPDPPAPAMPAATPPPPPGPDPVEGEMPWRLALSAAGVLGLAGVLAAANAWRVRVRRDVSLDPRQDLAELVRAVVQDPRAFAHLPGLLARPLLRCLDGRLLALGEARDLASRGRLYVAGAAGGLGQRARRAGARVLDLRCNEARVAAEALGAIDLDLWGVRLAACRASPLLDDVARRLAAVGHGWRLALADGLGDLAVLDLRARPWRAAQALRVVLLDPSLPWLRAAHDDHARWPCTARLNVAERLARRLRLDDDERLELLGPLARAALDEATG
jgi:transglutaminase-like putative cysteine protease